MIGPGKEITEGIVTTPVTESFVASANIFPILNPRKILGYDTVLL